MNSGKDILRYSKNHCSYYFRRVTANMKRLLPFLFLIISCTHTNAQVESKAFDRTLQRMLAFDVPTVSVPQLAKEGTHTVTLLDARERKEFDVSHLKNARWVGYDDFNMQRVAGIDKKTPIVIYCSIGYRSEKIGEKLKAAGFSNIRNLYGSIFEWKNQGNPVYDNAGKPTERVHAFNRIWGVWLNEGEKVY